MEFVKSFVAFTMATINIDGKADRSEYNSLMRVAKELNIDTDLVKDLIQKELNDPTMLEELNIDLLSYEERVAIYKACVEIILSDEELAISEISAVNYVSRLLCIQEEFCTIHLISCVKNKEKINIVSAL